MQQQALLSTHYYTGQTFTISLANPLTGLGCAFKAIKKRTVSMLG